MPGQKVGASVNGIREAGLRIRPARPGEAGLVLGFVRELAEYEKLMHEVDATEAMIDSALFGSNPRTFCDFAEWDGEPVGFVLWFLNFSSFRGRHGIYLEDVFVQPAHRGKGIGKAVLRHLAKRCVAEGWTRLEWAVLDWNTPSIGFYQAQGAVLMDEWTICRVTGPALMRLAAGEAAR
jgi:GNAT superfamily N-acetyltransferase